MRLGACAGSLEDLTRFYGAHLGLEQVERADEVCAFRIGATSLEFVARAGAPFYHFALLVPGDRFAAALDWAREQTELLPDPESGERVFDFANWGALACYFHDPAGNIVELIAHRGVGETKAEGRFAAAELLGLSELGLVGDPAAMASELGWRLGLALWDGTVEGDARLAFVGERARTLILSPAGRPWLPTGRPAEPHPVEAVLAGVVAGEALLEDGRHRIRSTVAFDD